MHDKKSYCKKHVKILKSAFDLGIEGVNSFIDEHAYLEIHSPKPCRKTEDK
jgi:hypothetical protein